MKPYARHTINRVQTPQSTKVPGVKKQVRNSAGGISFKISKLDYMKRFLMLGTEGGTYYVNERKLTIDAAKNVETCINKGGTEIVDLIVEISTQGRASNNDAAIFCLAIAVSCKDAKVRKYALTKIPEVCRIGTHLFTFMAYVKTMRGFGRGLKQGIAKWYTDKHIDSLAYQVLKYQQRDGWEHRDVLRLCHAMPINEEQNKLFSYIVGKRDTVPKVSGYAVGVREIQEGNKNYSKLIYEYNLTREVIPTEALNNKDVWEALLQNMPMTALVRNLGKMASMQLHVPFTKHAENSLNLTISKLTDPIAISRSRIHPIALMNALLVYKQGHGIKGSLKWEPNGKVCDALEEAFYMSFDSIEPTGKNIMLALDVSGSMSWEGIAGLHMNCREASAILAMATMRTEPNTFIAGFTSAGSNGYSDPNTSRGYGRGGISMLPITAKQDLTSVVKSISDLDFGATDCSLPMLYCIKKNIDVDAIVIYTDNETWSGNIHPWQALEKYQDKVGHEVKLVVVGMTATRFSIAKPDAPNMLDVVGFDTNTPAAISNFIR